MTHYPLPKETYAQYKKRMDEHLKNKLEELKDKDLI